MRLNVITDGCGWILDRCARELEARLPDVTVDGPREGAVNYYLPYWKRQRAEGTAQIGLFTHGFDRARSFVGAFTGYVCMNTHMAGHLARQGVSHARIHTIRPGHYAAHVGASTPATSVTFGVVGNTYRGGRKGEHLVSRMVEAGYQVRAIGRGWPAPAAGEIAPDGAGTWLLPAFYRELDYLVVTSTDEGGPMPVVDALHFGCPVIAPRGVGWCDEFPCLRYTAGDWASLNAVLRGLTVLPTWAAWADGHRHLLEQIRSAA